MVKPKYYLLILAFVIAGLLILSSSFSPKILADGMVIPPSDYYVQESEQKAVIWHDGKTETLILSVVFKGDAKNFAWIIPVPGKPNVEKGQDSLFTALENLTRPKINQPLPQYDISMGIGEGKTTTNPVTVIETKKVDIYDIKVLSSTDSKALSQWFIDNNYPYPDHASYILDSYINNHWFFIAAKVSAEALGSIGTDQLNIGHATPLKITFPSSKIVYPMRISSILPLETDNPPNGEVRETDWQEFNGYLYKRIWTGTKNWDESRISCTSQGADLTSITSKEEEDFIKNLCGIGNTCRLGNRGGYCAKPYPNWVDEEPFVYENWSPGEPEFACGEDCLDINEKGLWNNEWCQNPYCYEKFSICKKKAGSDIKIKKLPKTTPTTMMYIEDSQEGLSRNEYIPPTDPTYRNPGTCSQRSNNVNVLLYIFSDHKKEIPGFSTQYAGFVDGKKIEKLAQTDTGDPWIKTSKKMYLTKLTGNMIPQEMTQDLFPQTAENDKSVNQDNPFLNVGKIVFIGIPFLLEVFVLSLIILKRKANR